MSSFKFDTNKIMKSVEQQSVNALNKRRFDTECPHCHKKVNIPTGKSNCVHCGKQIDLKLNISFD